MTRFTADTRGATYLEYCALISCIAILAIAAYSNSAQDIAESLLKHCLSVMGLKK